MQRWRSTRISLQGDRDSTIWRRTATRCGAWPLRGAHRTQELADLKLEPVAFHGQRLRRRQHLRRGRSGLAGAALYVRDIRVDLGGAMRRLLDVAGNLLGRGALFLDS